MFNPTSLRGYLGMFYLVAPNNVAALIKDHAPSAASSLIKAGDEAHKFKSTFKARF
jgi:hypothetical protein